MHNRVYLSIESLLQNEKQYGEMTVLSRATMSA